jgi:hypothetical protein
MLGKKKIVVLAAVVAIAVVAAGVYALTLSNTLTTSWTVTSGTPLTLSFNPPPNLQYNYIPWGTYDYFGLRVRNPTAATFASVNVNIQLTTGPIMPATCVYIWWSSDNATWASVTLSGFGSGTLTGTLWGISSVTPSFDSTLYFRIMFDSTMPQTAVSTSISCVQ